MNQNEEEYFDVEDEFDEMMPCDVSGFCCGTGCSHYYQCQGK